MGSPHTWDLTENEFEQFTELLSKQDIKATLEERETSENLLEGAVSGITYNGYIRHQKGLFHFTLEKRLEDGGFRFAWLILKDCEKKENKPFVQNLSLELSKTFPSGRGYPTPPSEVTKAKQRRNLRRFGFFLAFWFVVVCFLFYFAIVGLRATFH